MASSYSFNEAGPLAMPQRSLGLPRLGEAPGVVILWKGKTWHELKTDEQVSAG